MALMTKNQPNKQINKNKTSIWFVTILLSTTTGKMFQILNKSELHTCIVYILNSKTN